MPTRPAPRERFSFSNLDEVLALPMFPGLTEAEQDVVICAVRDAVERHAGGSSAAAEAVAR